MTTSNRLRIGAILTATLFLFTTGTMAFADVVKTKFKSIDLTIDLPTAGSSEIDAENTEKVKLHSAKTSVGDLATMGVATIQEITWIGEFDRTDEEDPKFKPGYTYRCELSVLINPEGKYVTNYVMKNGEYHLDNNLFKSTVNGITATTQESTPYYPRISFYYTIPGEKGKKEVAEAKKEYEEERNSYRYMSKPYSQAQADELWVGKQAYDVVVFNRANKPEEGYESSDLASYGAMFPKQKSLFVTKLILDINNDDVRGDWGVESLAGELCNTISGPYNLREVWLGKEVDALAFVKAINNSIKSPLFPLAREYRSSSILFFTGKATLIVPEEQIGPIRTLLAKDPTEPVYTIKTYTGDVYAAQKAGVNAAKDWCTKHVFTAKIDAADRVCYYGNCSRRPRWFYSCMTCGKCEHNPNHTFANRNETGEVYDKDLAFGHDYSLDLATDEAYIGVNAVGNHIYYKSCLWCKHSVNYHETHISRADWKASGVDGSYDDYKEAMAKMQKTFMDDALTESTAPVHGFALPKRSTAKTSTPQAQSDATQALNDNLIDDELLGNDYTKPLTRLQLISIAVRLAENMTGKSVSESNAKDFTDIDNDYTRKASTMALMTDIAQGTLNPTAVPTRQELATVIYRTLRYIEAHSKYSYSDYVSKLSQYSDQSQISSWATEAMAFTNALELLDPATPTTLAPTTPCTIEQALTIAERGTLAHRAGWYQAAAYGEMESDGFIGVGVSNNNYSIMAGEATIGYSVALSERIWVNRLEIGYNGWLPTIEPYSGGKMFAKERFYHPIRNNAKEAYASDTSVSTKSKDDKKSHDKSADSNNTPKSSKKKGGSGMKLLKKGLNIINQITR